MPIAPAPERLALRALRVSRWVLDLATGRTARRAAVHSVFPRAVNLRLGDATMLSLSAPGIALAPNGVALELPTGATMGSLGIRPGQSAALGPLGLGLPEAHIEVTFADAAPWEPRPRPRPAALPDLARRARAAREVVIAEGACDSLLPLLWLLDDDATPVSSGLVRIARQPAALLVEAAARCDAPAVARASRRLGGLGPGLTPSGDDFLAGFAAAWVLSGEALGVPRTARDRVSTAILAAAAGMASALGEAWLGHAVRGEVAEPMAGFFTALFAGDAGALPPLVRTVLRLGATSGTDWSVGALLGVRAALGAAGRGRS